MLEIPEWSRGVAEKDWPIADRHAAAKRWRDLVARWRRDESERIKREGEEEALRVREYDGCAL